MHCGCPVHRAPIHTRHRKGAAAGADDQAWWRSPAAAMTAVASCIVFMPLWVQQACSHFIDKSGTHGRVSAGEERVPHAACQGDMRALEIGWRGFYKRGEARISFSPGIGPGPSTVTRVLQPVQERGSLSPVRHANATLCRLWRSASQSDPWRPGTLLACKFPAAVCNSRSRMRGICICLHRGVSRLSGRAQPGSPRNQRRRAPSAWARRA